MTFDYSEVVDLSDYLYADMPSWATLPSLKYDYYQTAVRDLFTISIVTRMHMHLGTHVDVELHSVPEGRSVEKYPVDNFVGEGVVLDLRNKRAGEEITEQELSMFDSEIREKDVVMLCTDWSKKKGFNQDYIYRWPFLGPSACKYLVRKKVKAVGTEAMSIAGWTGSVPAHGPVTSYSSADIHNMLLQKGIVIIEGLANLSYLIDKKKDRRALFVFAPVKFTGVEGAPCRALALLD
ncbi:MAG: cyclase family protein [Nitrososphaerota archaeon]